MDFPFKVQVKDEEGTTNLAVSFSKILKPDNRIVLNGDLGSGKTFFIKYVLIQHGITNVSSPSFSIINEYNGKYKFYHFDFYRIKKMEELLDIGWYDYMNEVNSIVFIEWGNLFRQILPKKFIEVNIHITNANSRQFEFIKYD